ncbi:MAG: YraN family protein [Desulfobulbaceae bacterium]|nr:YraN family protein [Desulfobulbaceae bacterium]
MFKGSFPLPGFLKDSNNHISLGQNGEDAAAAYLQKKGYKVLARNYRQRFGELDIIARDGEVLVFVEVKTRRSQRYGTPFEAVDRRKQRQLSKVALHYISRHNLYDQSARFDIVAVTWGENGAPQFDLLTNAFDVCE